MTRRFTEQGFQVFGYEHEVSGISVAQAKRVLSNAGLHYVWVKQDSTPAVSAEIVFPPMPNTDQSWDKIREVLECLEQNGAECGTVDLGGHVHLSARRVINLDEAMFMRHSMELASNSDADSPEYPSSDLYGDLMPIELLKDVIRRYATFQPTIDSMLPRSRRDYRMAQPVPQVLRPAFDNLQSIRAIDEYMGGKFRVINVSPWTTKQTIEFRQHQSSASVKKLRTWVELLMNMFVHSDMTRLDYSSEQETDIQPFRPFSRNGTAWALCRTPAGASVRELMDGIGWTPNNVRRTISEWRNRFGDDVVETISQQNNGASYGDGDTHTRYRIRETMGGGISRLPENHADIGTPSIYGGLADEWFEYIQERVHDLN